jgi:hypothetical protein
VKRSFLLTHEAKADLREILLDIAEDSPDAAERLRSEFYESSKRLSPEVFSSSNCSLRSFDSDSAMLSLIS